MRSTLDIAQLYLSAGVSILPIRADGATVPNAWKAPAVRTWKPYQARYATPDELCQWYGPNGIGAIGGAVSANLEIMDFDDPSKLVPWSKSIVAHGLGSALKQCALVQTPKMGWHVYYRSECAVDGNLKLAFNVADGKKNIAIETRGEGGYVVAPGSPISCHQTLKPYKLIHGSFRTLPVLTTDHIRIFHDTARSFDQTPVIEPPIREHPIRPRTIGLLPSDDFDQRGDMRTILTRHGWTFVSADTEKEHWRRPGKKDGTSATIGHCSHDGIPLLYVFSGNAYPFEAEQSYGPYRVYLALECGGDSSAAFKSLRREGYGDDVEFVREIKEPARPAYSWLSRKLVTAR